MIINTTTKQVQTMSTHPHDNWMGDGWIVVPPELEDKAREYAPFCDLVFDGGKLADIADNGTRPEQGEPETGDDGVIGRLLAEIEALRAQVESLANIKPPLGGEILGGNEFIL